MEIKDMNLEELETELRSINDEIDGITEQLAAEDADVEALEVRSTELGTRKDEVLAALAEAREAEAKKKETRAAVIGGDGKEIKKFEERETKTMEEIRNSVDYINAFANYVKTGNDSECRSLLSDNVSGGVVPVPTFCADIVAEALKDSKILSRVRHMSSAGNIKVGFEIDAPEAGTHEEGGAAMNEEALKLGIVTMIPKTYKKWVSVSDEALDSMSGEAYLNYIYDEVSRGIIKAREKAVVDAILAAPQTATETAPAVAVTGKAKGAIDDIINAVAKVSTAASNLVVILSRADYAMYKGLQISANYAVDPFDGLTPITSDYATVPIVGDLEGVMENLPKGDAIEFKLDDKSRMKEDMVDILGRQPSAIAVVGNEWFCKVSA